MGIATCHCERSAAIESRGYVVAAAFLLTIVSTAKYNGGSGTAADPYQIATAADLIALGETPADYDKHFVLTADIDLDPKLPGRKVFDKAVIAPDTDPKKVDFQGIPFIGVFDGNGHTISHLTLKGEGYLGLFGQLGSGAAVRKLGVVAVNITGSADPGGGLAAESIGAVTQCYSSGAVSGWDVGGLVGFNGGVMIQCYSTAAVSSNESAGGLVMCSMGYVTQCYSTGAVSGGLIWSVGGLVGGSSPVTGCFWDTQISGQATSGGGTGKTTAEMQTASTFLDAGWDFVGTIDDGNFQIWKMPEGGGYPVLAVFNGYTPPRLQGAGTPEDPYTVSDALELGAVVYYSPYAHYRLTASIDLSGIHWRTAVIPWFAGTFDGSNHTISNLAINGGSDLGLFGQLTGEVRDLGVVDVNVVGSGGGIGGLVGENYYGNVTRCYSSGRVSSTGGSVGGLVGQSGENGGGGDPVVTQCYSTAVVTGGSQVGGLVGFSDGDVTHCYSTGAVSGSASCVGGLVGAGDGFSTVTQCYSTGAVRGNSDVGGLVGDSGGTVTACYSTGTVSGEDGVGGLVGVNYGTAAGCYSTGAVNGKSRVGGLVGDDSWGISVTRCFWDTQSSGQAKSAGGTTKTTAQMQTAKTFLDAGWDFVGETKNGTEDIWWILEGEDYPRLWWQAAKK